MGQEWFARLFDHPVVRDFFSSEAPAQNANWWATSHVSRLYTRVMIAARYNWKLEFYSIGFFVHTYLYSILNT
jgi:hypothetical protein